jgi:plastocyanin
MHRIATNITRLFAIALIATLVLPMMGCGEDKRQKQKPSHAKNYRTNKGGSGASATTASVDISNFGPAGGKVDLSNPATIKGAVRFEGTPIPQIVQDLTKDKWCSKNYAGTVKSEEILVSGNAGLKNVLVYLVGLDDHGGAFAEATEAFSFVQQGCRYTPHIITLRVDQDIKISNRDNTNHNYHFVGSRNDAINKTQNGVSESVESFSKAEIGARMECNVHPWMKARVHIFEHPCFTISAADGSYTITGVPPGRYLLSFWHERCGESSQEVTVAAGETKSIGDVKFSDD